MGYGHRFKEGSGFDFEYSSNIQLRLIFFLFFIHIFSSKAKLTFFNINHIAICMCNSLKIPMHLIPSTL